MQKMESSKTKGLVNMDTTLQPLIDATIKKYKNLQNIFSGLSAQKTYVVNQYQTDLNDFINNNFQTRYNRSQYLALKNEVNIFKAKYYTINNQLNCSNILATSDE